MSSCALSLISSLMFSVGSGRKRMLGPASVLPLIGVATVGMVLPSPPTRAEIGGRTRELVDPVRGLNVPRSNP